MPVNVPTAEEFSALERRVTALEKQEPIPPAHGVQAKRAADLIGLFGVNTFSSLNEHNLWGSWPADYRPEQVIAALNWITDGTGYRFRIREYHYSGRTEMQREWLQQIEAAIPGTHVALCVGANGGVPDANSMLALGQACGADWLEGLNEPNTNFGSGEVPFETTEAIQQVVWDSADVLAVMGPSIVAGMPHPEGWITGYCGPGLVDLNQRMDLGNGHYYPPTCPDLKGSGTSVEEYVTGLSGAYGDAAMELTEFHPSLYNSEGHKPGEPGWDGTRDAYYTLLTLFRCAKMGVGLWWYALFDYGTAYICGLFPTKAENPRPAAHALRNLCRLCADPAPYDFIPGQLDMQITGLTPDMDWGLYATSEDRFIVTLWRSAKELGGETRPVTIEVAGQATFTEWDVVSGHQITPTTQGTRMVSALDASVRAIVITLA